MIAVQHGEAIQGCGQMLEPYCGECHSFLSLEQVREFALDVCSVEDVSDAWGDSSPSLWLCVGESSVCKCRSRSMFVHAWGPGAPLDKVLDDYLSDEGDAW